MLNSPFLHRLAVAVIVLTIVGVALQVSQVIGPAKLGTIDWSVTWAVGQMIAEGRIEDAHTATGLLAQYKALFDAKDQMLWTYPPPYSLLAWAMGALPHAASYVVFMALSLPLWLRMITVLAGPHATWVLVLVMPAVVVNAGTGQNGFLTAGLLGWASLLLLRARRLAGLPLGLMVIKPHLAAGLALLPLLRRQGGVVLLALTTVALACGSATLAFGLGVWPAFRGAVAEASGLLVAGVFPLHRMASMYALAAGFGAPASWAFGLQAVSAGVALLMLLTANRKGLSTRRLAGLAVMASMLISPYLYDYDLPLLGIALALFSPDIAAAANRRERMGVICLSLVATCNGMLALAVRDLLAVMSDVPPASSVPTVAGAALVALTALLYRISLRAHQTGDIHDDGFGTSGDSYDRQQAINRDGGIATAACRSC